MLENDANMPSHNDNLGNSAKDYLERATQAYASGNPVLAMHLCLAAFERGVHDDGSAPEEVAIEALRRAWGIAISLKERSIAEYAFERMEPYVSSDELSACAEQLQSLALDKLEEYGLSREDLEDMTDMISQDLLDGGPARLMRVEHIVAQRKDAPEGGKAADEDAPEPVQPPAPHAAASGAGKVEADAGAGAGTAASKPASAHGAEAPAMTVPAESISYKDLAGYDAAIATMRDFGVGMEKDPGFQDLVRQLNTRHGLDRMPASDALLFCSPAREDAHRFMMATLGELGLPAIRMHMEENLQGMPVLCVMAQADNQPKMNRMRNAFEGPGVLVLEDLDMWVSPMSEPLSGDDFNGFLFASLSRGAREAINLIRSAVDNPEVFVLASCAEGGAEVDPFFYDLLEPLSVIDIDYPTDTERADIWMEIAREHPSVRGVDQDTLVRYSAQMPRYDIYMAAREAVEEAYKASLAARRYVAVTSDNLFDKLAAYQPLDSAEYKALEEAVISDFRRDLEHLDDLLDEGRR